MQHLLNCKGYIKSPANMQKSFYSKDGEEHRIPYATKKEIAEELMQLVNRKMTEE